GRVIHLPRSPGDDHVTREVSQFHVTADGRDFGYIAAWNSATYLGVNDKIVSMNIRPDTVTLHAAAKVRYAVWQQGGGESVAVDGKAHTKYDAILDLKFSDNGAGYAFVARRGDEHVVV